MLNMTEREQKIPQGYDTLGRVPLKEGRDLSMISPSDTTEYNIHTDLNDTTDNSWQSIYQVQLIRGAKPAVNICNNNDDSEYNNDDCDTHPQSHNTHILSLDGQVLSVDGWIVKLREILGNTAAPHDDSSQGPRSEERNVSK